MKKVLTVLILLAVIAGCILAAGCTGVKDDTLPPENVAYTVTVVKEGGTTFNEGSIAALTFKTNPTTGYDWQVVEGKEILYKTFRNAEDQEDENGLKLVGAPSDITFWFQPEEEGAYPIELAYARPWDIENTTISTYSDIIYVVKSDEPIANGPKASFTFDSFNINPIHGSVVEIITDCNPTTGYEYVASGDGLFIKEYYELPNEQIVGAVGKYNWYVTAAKPGDYEFKATLKKAGSDEEVSSFTVSLKFT